MLTLIVNTFLWKNN